MEIKKTLEIFEGVSENIRKARNGEQHNNLNTMWDKAWISVDDIIKKLEEHEHCHGFHKIPTDDDPKGYHEASCLYVIRKELHDELKRNE